MKKTLRVYDRSMMPSAEVYEAYAGEMDAETLTPRSVDLQFYQGTAVLEIRMNMDNGNASGTRKVTRPGHGSETKEIAAKLPTVKDGGLVETPTGQFDTLIYELRGGAPENDIFVSTGENPKIVRIDVIGQPLQFLAIENSNADLLGSI